MRYERQYRLPEIGLKGQQQLQKARVLLVGVGGLGCPVLQYLLAAGVGELHLLDADCVELSNLQRQVIFTENDLGRPKVLAAQQRLQTLNTECRMIAHHQALDSDNASDYLQSVDLVLDCTDNLAIKYLLNDVAYELEKPLVSASLLQFKAQVVRYHAPHTPCMRCLFPPSEYMEIPDCNQAGILGAVAGVVGCWQALEAIKWLVKADQTNVCDLLSLDLWHNNVQRYAMTRDPDCALCVRQQRDSLIYPKVPVFKHQISWDEFNAHPQRQQFCLIDVREPHEHQAQNFGGINFPLNTLSMASTDLDPQGFYLLYCRSGRRSQKAWQLLHQQGFQHIYTLRQ